MVERSLGPLQTSRRRRRPPRGLAVRDEEREVRQVLARVRLGVDVDLVVAGERVEEGLEGGQRVQISKRQERERTAEPAHVFGFGDVRRESAESADGGDFGAREVVDEGLFAVREDGADDGG